MLTRELTCAAVLGIVFGIEAGRGAASQTPAADAHHPSAALAQATPTPAPGMGGQGQPAQPGTVPPSTMGQGMGQGMMGQSMMSRMMQSGGGMRMMGMHGPIMRIMFAVADANGDGGLSMEEISTVHRRIFESVDSNKDGKVTPQEMDTFMHGSP